MLTIFGSIALDTTRTPFITQARILGGAATYASLSASYFNDCAIVGIVGNDFPEEYWNILRRKADVKGIIRDKFGKTFHYDSSFDYDLSKRTTNKTELNVIEKFEPTLPKDYTKSEFIYLANNDPQQNIKLLEYFNNPKLTICDTIEYWIKNKKEDVIEMIKRTNGVIINDDEARMLCKVSNLVKCAKIIKSWGPEIVVIKKGENGCFLFYEDIIYPLTAYPIEDIVDPTGAGDSFAGAFIGYIASKNKVGLSTLKEASIFGNILGSFVVEGFGVKRLLELSIEDIINRYNNYKKIVSI